MSPAPLDVAMPPRQKLYLYLAAIFITALLVGDIIGSKLFVVQLTLFGRPLTATLSVGAMWFPITFVLTDVINEFYGARGARAVTFVGFWMALAAFGAIWIARQIPAASFSPIPQEMFDQVFGGANRIFFASIVAYMIGQLLDITLFQALKKLTHARHIWLRSTGSTLASQLIDSVVVVGLAFGDKLQLGELVSLCVTSYLVKVIAAVGLTPVIYAMHALIQRRLGIEPTAAAGEQARA
jgi:queuosine precursor transporter